MWCRADMVQASVVWCSGAVWCRERVVDGRRMAWCRMRSRVWCGENVVQCGAGREWCRYRWCRASVVQGECGAGYGAGWGAGRCGAVV